MTNMGNVWVYVEVKNGKPSELSLELLGKGRQLADSKKVQLVGLLIGHSMADAAKDVIRYRADQSVCVENAAFTSFDGKLYTKAVEAMLKKYNPNVMLIGGSVNGRELGGRLSAAMNIGLVADCIDCSYASEDDAVTWIRPAYTGKLFVKILTTTRPQLATISGKIFHGNAFDAARTGKVTQEALTIADLAPTQKVVSFVADADVKEVSKDLTIENAKVVVGAGRGVGTQDGMKQVQAMAKAIGAGFGTSKPLVDEGWAPHDWQVGITGKQIAPDIYIALGISGSIQHQLGIKEAKLVIAVNTDPEAPIFKRANYGIVGDLFKALPMIQAEFKKS